MVVSFFSCILVVTPNDKKGKTTPTTMYSLSLLYLQDNIFFSNIDCFYRGPPFFSVRNCSLFLKGRGR